MKMTWKKLEQWILEGRGTGHKSEYKPFLQVTRRNTSKVSNQSFGRWLFGYNREFHYFSRSERKVALIIKWLGASDIREQFPLWPSPHLHPLVGADGTNIYERPIVSGLIEIAQEAGIDHGNFVGSDVPYVATIDLMATIQTNMRPFLVGISCKPEKQIIEAEPSSRLLERLELERLYFQAIQTRRVRLEDNAFHKELVANLEWFKPDANIESALRKDDRFEEFLAELNEKLLQTNIDNAIKTAHSKIGWNRSRANAAFRLAVWHQLVDIDISKPIVMSLEATTGGKQLKKTIRLAVIGADDGN